ncbi:hypothetical protein COU17_03330 [Candidatus Kaiserbacteria bacterium CG10_big_fil_rev_8_21_14_0_10_49_17]|uniref:Glycosyl transferase family 1 domain-containing protein n=1 Tax=Candidatus Kaiserbacteria bacterium CG10_big_fil_rev_8_21_14_0_10_49_17 TaxID=1974609 RepID=A0A2M6WDU6_9BACT|nr:MAG: hypothetical protein COU17_03330 [Candidatus Kaiserbacteria bacterium CG10_big_fil_rev_8_21_14_0_10_49_17]
MNRLLIFSLAYYPKHVGGAEVAIKEITDRIPQEDIEFHMVCNRYDSTLPKEEQIGNVFVHRIGITKENPSMGDLKKFPLHLNKYLFQFWAAWKAHQLHVRYQYDGVWAMMAHSTGVPAGLFKTFHPSVPYLLTLQEGDPLDYIQRTMRPVYPLFVRGFRKADMVQAISTFLARWARDMGFTGELEVIPNAVNMAHFSQEYSPHELASLKEKIGKKDGDIYIITTSRLVKKNAVDDVIRALAFLPAHVHFLILGTGPDEEQLKALAAREGVAGRVHFLGQVDHSEMPKYLKISDIFTRPSRSEGMGNSFVEAMAAGLPVIATQEGGIADFLFDEKKNREKETTGWAVDPDSPAQIADAVKDILARPEKVAAVRETAKALVKKKYDWDIIVHEMQEKVFAPLVKKG